MTFNAYMITKKSKILLLGLLEQLSPNTIISNMSYEELKKFNDIVTKNHDGDLIIVPSTNNSTNQIAEQNNNVVFYGANPPKSNAEEIRQMDDYVMANFLVNIAKEWFVEGIPNRDRVEDWLKSKATKTEVANDNSR